MQYIHLDFPDTKISLYAAERSHIQKRLAPRVGNGSRIEDLWLPRLVYTTPTPPWASRRGGIEKPFYIWIKPLRGIE